MEERAVGGGGGVGAEIAGIEVSRTRQQDEAIQAAYSMNSRPHLLESSRRPWRSCCMMGRSACRVRIRMAV